jgi:Thioredoxin
MNHAIGRTGWWRGARSLPGMNPLPRDVWSRRLSYAAYLATASCNRDVFDEAYRHPGYQPADLAWLRQLPPLRVLAIGEDWCPDVYHTLPTWARLAEELPGWELGVFARDANPEVMDAFLWRGERRRIPVYAFYLGDLLQVWWSGRGAAAERQLAAFLAGRSIGDLSPDERRRAQLLLHEGYRREYRRQNLEEILALLHAFFHVAA